LIGADVNDRADSVAVNALVHDTLAYFAVAEASIEKACLHFDEQVNA